MTSVQRVHSELPWALVNFPFSQSSQVEAAVPLILPMPQSTHSVLIVLLWVPAEQTEQNPLPGEAAMKPSSQSWHSSMLAAPVECLPAGQGRSELSVSLK